MMATWSFFLGGGCVVRRVPRNIFKPHGSPAFTGKPIHQFCRVWIYVDWHHFAESKSIFVVKKTYK